MGFLRINQDPRAHQLLWSRQLLLGKGNGDTQLRSNNVGWKC